MHIVKGTVALALLTACADAYISPTSGFLLRPALRPKAAVGRAAHPLSNSIRSRDPAFASSIRAACDERRSTSSVSVGPVSFDISKFGSQVAGACAALSIILGGSVFPPEDAFAYPDSVAKLATQAEQGVIELSPEIKDKVQVFAEILNDINSAYVDPIDLTKITETGFNAMLQSLDPYTEYENIKATESMRTTTQGNYGGVGLAISKVRDPSEKEEPYVYVMQSFEGYAFDAGVRVGDKIISVDGKDVASMSVGDVSEMLRGKRGTEVKITFERPGLGKFEKVLQRRQVPLRDVPVALLLDDKNEVGYLKLSGFSATAPLEMAFVLNNMQKQSPNLKALVLDLRGNTGGLLSSAIKIADFFLPDGVTVVSTKGRIVNSESEEGNVIKAEGINSKGEVKYKANQIRQYVGQAPDGRPLFNDIPVVSDKIRVVVLTDHYTASASEIVAGAIQDHDRGILLGETTYGKGLVQQLQRLSGGRQIKFTSGKYYTPSGRCIQNKVYAAKSDGRGTEENKIKDADRKVFYTDNGRPVRDGGGIEPDVPLKPVKAGQLEQQLNRWEAFFKYAAVLAPQITDGEAKAQREAPMVSDEDYANFEKWAVSQTTSDEMNKYGPFAKSLELFKEALEDGGYTEAIADVKSLQKHLTQLIIGEFKTEKEQLKNRLETAVRSRFVPESKVLAASVTTDKQIEEAMKYAEDPALYAQTIKSVNPSSALAAAKDAVKSQDGKIARSRLFPERPGPVEFEVQ